MSHEAKVFDSDLFKASYVIEDVELTEPVGSGAYAKVYRGRWKGIPVAVKKLHDVFFEKSVGVEQQDGMLATFRKEVCMNVRLRHPNVIQFLGVCYFAGDSRVPMMVMELMDSTLEKRLCELREKGVRMPLHEVINIATDVAAGLVYLHEQTPTPISHRDLAPKNVLLSAEGRAKLCDLGVAKATDESRGHTRGPGTPAFMPPEVIISTKYSPMPVDIYSFGVILLEMCSGIDSDPTEFVRENKSTDILQFSIVPEKERRAPSFAALGSDHLLDEIISSCLESSASARPKARDVLAHLSRLKESEGFNTVHQNPVRSLECDCEQKDETIKELWKHIEDQNLQLKKYQEEIKSCREFQEQRLASLQEEIESVVIEAQKNQAQVLHLKDQLNGEVEVNKALQVSHDRTVCWNELLRQKVEMDTHPDRFSNPPLKKNVHSESFRQTGSATAGTDWNHSTKPKRHTINQPRQNQAWKKTPPSRNRSDPSVNMYVSLDADAMVEDMPYVGLPLAPSRLPMSIRVTETESAATRMARDYPKSRPNPGNKAKREDDTTEHEKEHLYTEIPMTSGPPLPPPRPAFPQRPRSCHIPPRIVEIDEDGVATPTTVMPGSKPLQRKVQSLKARVQSPPQNKRPTLMRQGSRGDVLISRVTTNYKAKNPTELTVTKGELVKVTNSAMDKKWCIAVTTNGQTGSVKKKHLEQVEAGSLLYDVANPVKSRQNGIINRIAICGNKQNVWVSPVEVQKITIIPSSLHSGEVNMLVKMTDYLLCCTDCDPQSSFEIDLHKQRMVKLTGYMLQCHYEGRNGYPRGWKLEGSHNGSTWTVLSEEKGDFFQEGQYANYFEVANPTPCRYFRLSQLVENSAENHRFCLSGIELYGHLYSSIADEMYTHQI